ncbi:MAG: hypothetical protein HQ582_21020 [Planctomycetes bacterium]|nr:hypothetical protein [Planctomycetota bacterium]
MFRAFVAQVLPQDISGAFWRGLAVSLALGFAYAYVACPVLGRPTTFGGPGRDGYLELGASLARGDGFVFEPGGPPATHHPPLTPLLLAPITCLPYPLQRPAVILLQSLLVGVTCSLIFHLASKAFSVRAAGYAAVILLTYPWLFMRIKNPMAFFIQLTATMLVVDLLGNELLRLSQRRSEAFLKGWWVRACVLGVAAAAAILTHGTMLASIPILLLALAIIGAVCRQRRTVYMAIVAGSVAVVVVAPWSYRNSKICHRFVPVATGAGLQYFYGNAHWGLDGRVTREMPWTRLMRQERIVALTGVRENPSDALHYWGWKDPDLDRQANQRMIHDITSDPVRFQKKLALNAIEFYLPVIHEVLVPVRSRGRVISRGAVAVSVWHLAYWSLALVGFFRLRRSRHQMGLWLLLGCVVSLVVFYVPFVVVHGMCGYGMVTLPLLAIMASVGLAGNSTGASAELALHGATAHPAAPKQSSTSVGLLAGPTRHRQRGRGASGNLTRST